MCAAGALAGSHVLWIFVTDSLGGDQAHPQGVFAPATLGEGCMERSLCFWCRETRLGASDLRDPMPRQSFALLSSSMVSHLSVAAEGLSPWQSCAFSSRNGRVCMPDTISVNLRGVHCCVFNCGHVTWVLPPLGRRLFLKAQLHVWCENFAAKHVVTLCGVVVDC